MVSQITAANLVKQSKNLPFYPAHSLSAPQHAEYSEMLPVAAWNSHHRDDK